MSWWFANAPSSVLALVTTVQAALTVLRLHRSARPGRFPLLIVPSVVFTAFPWIFSTPAFVAAALAAHIAWFAACEKLARASAVGEAASLPDGRPGDAAAGRASRSLRPREFVPVTVLAVHDESDTIRTFRLSRPNYFSFAAGQFLTVRVAVDGKPYARCYSVSSAPEASGYLEISVRRQGTVSNALHVACAPGSMVLVKPPAGKFTYPRDDERPLVLLAGGVGITPLMSMLRHAVVAEPWRRVTLLFSVKTEADIAFRDELTLLARRHPQVRIVVTLSSAEPKPRPTESSATTPPDAGGAGPKPRPAESSATAPLDAGGGKVTSFPTEYDVVGASRRGGRIDAALVRECVPSPEDSLFYICGPVTMIDAMRALLVASGVPKAQVRSEEFQPAAAIGARAASPAAVASGSPGVHTKLVLAVSNRIVDVPQGVTLLEAAEAGGASIPSLCRSGVCGTCKTRLLSGEVHCTSDALEADDRAERYTLPCVAWPAGDCALEA